MRFYCTTSNISIDGIVTGEENQNLFDGLAERGFTPEQKFQEEIPTETEPEVNKLVIEYPLDGFTPKTIDNLRKMVDAKEELIKKALDVDELPISVLNDRIVFPWFLVDLDCDTVNAYTQFIVALCKTAKEKKRITAKAPKSGFENERFSMRVWLIGLGMVGAEFSKARKLMMKNLEGNSGWRYGKPEKTAFATEVSEVQGDE